MVEVVATQKSIAVCCQYFKNAIVNLQNGNIERAATPVKNSNGLRLRRVDSDAVGQRSSGGFLDDAQHIEPGEFAGIAGCLALVIVEVSRHCDNRLRHHSV